MHLDLLLHEKGGDSSLRAAEGGGTIKVRKENVLGKGGKVKEDVTKSSCYSLGGYTGPTKRP